MNTNDKLLKNNNYLARLCLENYLFSHTFLFIHFGRYFYPKGLTQVESVNPREIQLSDTVILILILYPQQGGQSRKLQHYWYTSWPDQKTPESVGPLLQLVNDVEEDKKGFTSCGPIIVHCRYRSLPAKHYELVYRLTLLKLHDMHSILHLI